MNINYLGDYSKLQTKVYILNLRGFASNRTKPENYTMTYIRQILSIALLLSFLSPVYCQDAKPAETKKEEVIKASCYYPDLEPKQLFQMLSETYHVQFDGIELVSGPITLISREKVDVQGMIALLNEVLLKQNRKSILNGQIIQITQIQDIDKIIKLNNLEPDQTVEILKKRFMAETTESDSKNKQPSMIEPHPNGNSIIVRGPEKVIKEIEKYLVEIDIPSDTPKKVQAQPLVITEKTDSDGNKETTVEMPEIVIKSIDLKNAVTDEMIKYLKDVYLAGENASLEEKARKVYKIHKHPTQRKIVIEGPASVISEIELVIKDELDVAPPGPPIIQRYINLDYISVEYFQRLLENDPSLKDKYQYREEQNNVIVISTEDEKIFPIIENLKIKFDIDKKELRYIPLAYAKADDITNMLKQIYEQATAETPKELQAAEDETVSEDDITAEKIKASLSKSGIDDASLADRLSQSLSLVSTSEYKIVSDKTRNGLLIYTFSRNFPKILQMIAKLDIPEKMVYIEVFITQVNKSKGMEHGVKINYHDDFIMRGDNTPFNLDQSFDKFSNIGGFSYELLDQDFKLYLRAMETAGNVDVLSRPHLVTKNNVEGKITLGNRVPELQNVKTNQYGVTQGAVEYKDIATELKVKPQIHPDNFISMQITQTVDDISTDTFQISEDFNPQIINKREAQVELRIKDGQTVCLAGFTGDKLAETEEKVPILGSIPLLGNLFKYKDSKREKVEMIIFLTPHILETPEHSLRMTNEQRQRSVAEHREDDIMKTLEVKDSLVLPKYSDEAVTLREVMKAAAEEEQMNQEKKKDEQIKLDDFDGYNH